MIQAVPYRIVAVTNESLADIQPPLSFTSHSYCTPQCRFWLARRGLEDPSTPLVLIEFMEPIEESNYGSYGKMPNWKVEFDYDGGRYIGTYESNPTKAAMMSSRLNVPIINSFVYDISSL